MSDDKSKKPKIDLKARLGKTAVLPTGGTSGIPAPLPGSNPPSGPGSHPAAGPSAIPAPGIVPPPAISPGIPAPPFAPQPRVQPSAQPAPKPVAAAQTIKVEMGEEVQEERKKAAKKTAVYVALGSIVALGIGFFVGQAREKGARGDIAIAGAKALQEDVKKSNEKIKQLSELLAGGYEKLTKREFPADLAQQLAGINVPFELATLDGKGVGNLNPKLQKMVFSYTATIQELNEDKESLRNLLGLAQAPIEKAIKEEKDPVSNFSVIFRGDNKGMLAEIVANKEPFPFGKDWPASYPILKVERTQQGAKEVEKKATRWTKGDLTGNDPVAIPLDAASAGRLGGEAVTLKLSKAIFDIRKVIEGEADNPNGGVGLMREGDDLLAELRKIAAAK